MRKNEDCWSDMIKQKKYKPFSTFAILEHATFFINIFKFEKQSQNELDDKFIQKKALLSKYSVPNSKTSARAFFPPPDFLLSWWTTRNSNLTTNLGPKLTHTAPDEHATRSFQTKRGGWQHTANLGWAQTGTQVYMKDFDV